MPKTEHVSDQPEMIDVLVTRPSIFWLPQMTERDDKGVKIKTICSSLMLRPGANRIRKKRWEQSLSHPTIKVHIEVGTLKVNASQAEVSEHTHTPDPITGLNALSIEKARPWILASEDLDQLAKWRTVESKAKGRSGVLELIDGRTEALLATEDE